MPLPEGYLLRQGDEILVRARVRSEHVHSDGEYYLEIVGREHHKLFLRPNEMHSLHCRKWNVNDRVRLIGNDKITPLEVIGVCDDKAWVKFPSGSMATYEANQLEPYVEPPKADLGTDGPMAIEAEVPSKYGMQIPPPAPGSQADVDDDDEIKF